MAAEGACWNSGDMDRGIVFVDASKAGHMVTRNFRELADSDIHEIVEAAAGDAAEQGSGVTVRSVTEPRPKPRTRSSTRSRRLFDANQKRYRSLAVLIDGSVGTMLTAAQLE